MEVSRQSFLGYEVMMMKPFGMSGAYSMTVLTPNVLRTTTGADALGPVLKASMPVTEAKSLDM